MRPTRPATGRTMTSDQVSVLQRPAANHTTSTWSPEPITRLGHEIQSQSHDFGMKSRVNHMTWTWVWRRCAEKTDTDSGQNFSFFCQAESMTISLMSVSFKDKVSGRRLNSQLDSFNLFRKHEQETLVKCTVSKLYEGRVEAPGWLNFGQAVSTLLTLDSAAREEAAHARAPVTHYALPSLVRRRLNADVVLICKSWHGIPLFLDLSVPPQRPCAHVMMKIGNVNSKISMHQFPIYLYISEKLLLMTYI